MNPEDTVLGEVSQSRKDKFSRNPGSEASRAVRLTEAERRRVAGPGRGRGQGEAGPEAAARRCLWPARAHCARTLLFGGESVLCLPCTQTGRAETSPSFQDGSPLRTVSGCRGLVFQGERETRLDRWSPRPGGDPQKRTTGRCGGAAGTQLGHPKLEAPAALGCRPWGLELTLTVGPSVRCASSLCPRGGRGPGEGGCAPGRGGERGGGGRADPWAGGAVGEPDAEGQGLGAGVTLGEGGGPRVGDEA